MTNKGYMIYKLYNAKNDHTEMEFFLPDTDLKRVTWRLMTLASYKEKGYEVVGILKVDKEVYLNARLNETVKDYLYMDNQEIDTKVKFRCGMISYRTAQKTLEMIQDHKWTLLKKLAQQMRRLIREDYEVTNEIALKLYDDYIKAII